MNSKKGEMSLRHLPPLLYLLEYSHYLPVSHNKLSGPRLNNKSTIDK